MSTMRGLYGGTVFLSAFLLFAVEPMAAKRLLPVLGGSSAVWVTCLVFFQGMLLAGYLYAHWMARRGSTWMWVHLIMLGAAVVILLLPVALGTIGMDVHWTDASGHPVRTIFLALGATIGLPFLVLGSTSPLLQVWLARRQGGAVPYRLFALSNAGSLMALALYPTLIEPHLTLRWQGMLWGGAFLLYAAVCGWIGWQARRFQTAEPGGKSLREMLAEGTEVDERRFPVVQGYSRTRKNGRRWMCFLLPMCAAMQLSAVTSHLSQDVAAIPMLWVLPLGGYLATFILAFEAPRTYRRWLLARLLAVMLASLGHALSRVDMELPIGMAVLFYLAELFVACWFCHAEVHRLRPEGARQSTAFYLLLAAGGVAGSFLVGIASPLIFRANYDLAISFAVTAALAAAVTWRDGWGQRLLWATGTVLLLVLAMALHIGYRRRALVEARNFYGSLRVVAAEMDAAGGLESGGAPGSASTGTGPVRVLMNGRIRHGTQMLATERRRMPTTYYGENSGVGLALRYCCEGRAKSVGVVGLGVGTLAAYGQAGDRLRFYEINPLVEPIARNLFTYLRDSPASITVVQGDGRASLAEEAPQGFDVLVVDAFSGDAIPLHLLTREALAVYRRHLAGDGVMAFHVSNSYLHLPPEIERLATDAGLRARLVEGTPAVEQGVYRSTWVLVSGNAEFFSKPEVAAASTEIPIQPGLRLWTDNYSSLLPVLRWGR